MHREDDSKYLLYIEPKSSDKLETPIDDEITQIMELALSKAKKGIANYSSLTDVGDGYDWMYKDKAIRVPSFREKNGYMGYHVTECGKLSTNRDYLLENGMITNSLAPFYLKWYRYSIPESEMRKVNELINFYNKKSH